MDRFGVRRWIQGVSASIGRVVKDPKVAVTLLKEKVKPAELWRIAAGSTN